MPKNKPNNHNNTKKKCKKIMNKNQKNKTKYNSKMFKM